MQISVRNYRSLLWLSRWHNGQSLRLWQQLLHHNGVLSQLVLAELDGRTVINPVELTICGLHILCEVQPEGVKLYSISPPDASTGIQRNLFTLNNRPRQRERVIQFPQRPRNPARVRVVSAPSSPDERRGA